VEVLKIPEKTFLLDIFPASETNIYNVSSEALAEKSGSRYVEDEEDLREALLREASPRKAILFMGAGDISAICERIMETSGSFSEDLKKDTARKED